MKNSQKLLSILCHQKSFFVCVCIKWFKSAKKDTKNVKSKLLTNRRDLEVESELGIGHRLLINVIQKNKNTDIN